MQIDIQMQNLKFSGILSTGYNLSYTYAYNSQQIANIADASYRADHSGGTRTKTGKFTAYISPYMVVSNGGNYSKHIYMGSQRIVSKLSNSGGLYFYHPEHLGSSSLITDGTGALTQHIQYVPFGEVFVEERTNSWSTPYKFNGKELDEETGLYYYHARYYDPRLSVWLSVDPLAEKYFWTSSYVYCLNNPVKYTDPDGKQSRRSVAGGALIGWLVPPVKATTPVQVMQKDRLHVKASHNVLDVFGVVPIIGEPADALNGILYAIQGDKWSAGLSFAGAVPFFGWAAAGAKWISNGLKNVSKVDVKAVNKLFGKAAYSEAFDVVEGTTKREMKLVRVHGENNKIGGWMMDASDIKGLSPQEIQNKFALPELPTQVSDVLVPSGTQVRIGVAGKVDGWGNGGGVQVQALQDIPQNAFTNTRNLE